MGTPSGMPPQHRRPKSQGCSADLRSMFEQYRPAPALRRCARRFSNCAIGRQRLQYRADFTAFLNRRAARALAQRLLINLNAHLRNDAGESSERLIGPARQAIFGIWIRQ
jgi:hypothetical protein